VDVLELGKILDSGVDKISGGELQRVAIAATVLKRANLYLFDEPTSYLDIKQRIKISKFIKSLAVEGVAVMVIEHDIIILDYLADLIHLMYGAEGEYGVVSLAKSTKAGINIYLDGFIRDENMRFRDHKIVFERNPDDKMVSELHLTSWRDVDYEVGRFSLSIKEGEIKRRDVIGVLGENGIGKTTFARIITNEIKLDESVLEELKISYKPQYLFKSDELVRVYLADALKYDSQIIGPLQIKSLLNKTLNELSGGELQRVAIARCLGEKADLYVLDEPSAYLDVEQRLSMSRIIGDLMAQSGRAALIIDHDLLFLDYLSKKLLIFHGVPASSGSTLGPIGMASGMNYFLKELDITFRRDEESGRPRINKPLSQKDKEQKSSGKLYYTQ